MAKQKGESGGDRLTSDISELPFRAIVSTEGGCGSVAGAAGTWTPMSASSQSCRSDGKPDFPLICECLLQRRYRIPLTFMVFDVLRVDGQDVRIGAGSWSGRACRRFGACGSSSSESAES
jgi:hypothetical protein